MPPGERRGDRRRIDRTVATRDRLAGRQSQLSVVRQSPLFNIGNHDRRPAGFIRPPEGIANGAAENATENSVSHNTPEKVGRSSPVCLAFSKGVFEESSAKLSGLPCILAMSNSSMEH